MRTMERAARACLFCQITQGDLEAAIVFEDSERVAFLDHRPLFAGHCLLIPKTHYETLTDIPPDEIGPLFICAQQIARAVVESMSAEGFFVAMNNRISQSVPHLHVHIVPRRKKDGLKGFFWPRVSYQSDEEKERVRRAIADAIERSAQ